MKTIRILVLLTFMICSLEQQAQRGKGRHGGRGPHHRNKAVVVKRSPYRPAKVMVYHPYWRPHYGYNRRWVFFPRYNVYWDNWRNQYVFYNGGMWVAQTATPPVLVNVNPENEKN